MNEGIELITNSPAPFVEGGIHLQYLEGIAKLRYAIVVVVELLHCQHGASSRHQGYYTHETQLLLDIAKRCCINDIVNTDNSGPGVFLVKQLAKQYGVSFLTNLTSDETMQWIVPHHLQRSNEVDIIYFKYSGHYIITRNNKLAIHLSSIKVMEI